MKAIIVAAGIGVRLHPMSSDKPKSLIEIGGKALLDYQIDALIECNIKDIVITTGHLERKIREYVARKYPFLNVAYVYNPEYDTTNYIYSMWLARELIDDDLILIHGDLVFDEKLLVNMVNSNYENCVLVSRKAKSESKDFKAVVENNKVIKIGVEFFGENVLDSLPMYKLSRSDYLCWLQEIDKFIKNGSKGSYAEDAFNNISDKIILRPLYFNEEFGMEIDTKEDFKMAKNILKNRL